MSLHLTSHHFEVFGRVINAYATVETGIQIALSGILRVHLSEAMVITSPYSAAQLKNVAKSIAKIKLRPELAEQFVSLVGRWSAHSRLRNDIAHNRWTKGGKPGSIKPVYINIRDDKARFGGYDEEERDWTTDEIGKAFNQLASINEEIKTFLVDSGLDDIIDLIMAEDSKSTDDDDGVV
jgi:hypothetical protein